MFWTLKPGTLRLWSGVISRALATAIAIFGWYVSPISWQLVGLVWGLAAVELLVTDPLKLVTYRILDHTGIIFRRQTGGDESLDFQVLLDPLEKKFGLPAAAIELSHLKRRQVKAVG